MLTVSVILALLGLSQLAAAQLLPPQNPAVAATGGSSGGAGDGEDVTPFKSLFAPPSATSSAPPAARRCLPVLELASQQGNFTALIASSQAVGLDTFLDSPALMCPNGCTLFAPTDAAFNSLLRALDVSTADFLNKTESLAKVLSYHILPRLVLASQMEDAQKLPTLLTEAVAFNQTYSQQSGGKHLADSAREASLLEVDKKSSTSKLTPRNVTSILTIIPSGGSRAKVIRPDIPACSFVVHVIDKVLVPDLAAINGQEESSKHLGAPTPVSRIVSHTMPYMVVTVN